MNAAPARRLDDRPVFLRALGRMLDDAELFGPEGPCPVLFEPGREGTRLLLVTGENASGKSLVCRYIGAFVKRFEDPDNPVSFMHIAMELRCGPGLGRAVVFGDESIHSTGEISAGAVLRAIRISRDRKTPHVIAFDEPDVGLSEGYQEALARAIEAYARNLPEKAIGLIVVTHSRMIAARIRKLGAHCLRVGDDLRPTHVWLEKGPLRRSIADLQRLKNRSLKRFRVVTRILDARRARSTSA